jgi:hypothetical protein
MDSFLDGESVFISKSWMIDVASTLTLKPNLESIGFLLLLSWACFGMQQPERRAIAVLPPALICILTGGVHGDDF